VYTERERKRAREHNLALCLSTVLRVSCLQSINRILLRHLRHLSYRQDTHANVFSKHAIIQKNIGTSRADQFFYIENILKD